MKQAISIIFTFCAIAMFLVIGSSCQPIDQTQLEKDRFVVLSFNIMAGYRLRGQRLSQTIKLIQESKADIVGLQEGRGGSAERLAKLLGWNVVRQGLDSAILTRYKIVESSEWGAIVKLDSGQDICMLSLHLQAYPYQPYELLGIGKVHIKTEQEAIASAEKARGQSLATILKHIHNLPHKDISVFVIGDFNEPSHLDWTEKAAKSGRHPIKVAYPTSTAMAKAGFVDAWRVFYPDEMKKPGFTWTPSTKTSNPKDHHDRIDFVYYKGTDLQLNYVKVVGENNKNADIVVSPYPSDHRAVAASFTLRKRSKSEEKDANKSDAGDGK